MANEPTGEDDLTLDAQEAGIMFRAEMWLTDAFLGYWMYLVGLVAIFLACVFLYGQYVTWEVGQQRFQAEEIARIENKINNGIAGLAYEQASGQTLDLAALKESATKLEALQNSGAARAEALLKAAEIYRLVDQPADQRRALEGVEATGVQPMAVQASSSLANLDLADNQPEAAVARLEAIMMAHTDFLGEQAAIDLGLVYEHLEKLDEARKVYQTFEERWPKSPRLEQVRSRASALGAG